MSTGIDTVIRWVNIFANPKLDVYKTDDNPRNDFSNAHEMTTILCSSLDSCLIDGRKA